MKCAQKENARDACIPSLLGGDLHLMTYGVEGERFP
jgi:hypothetical protein